MPKYILSGISYEKSEKDVFEYLREKGIKLLTIRGLRSRHGENKGIYIIETEDDVFDQLINLCSEMNIKVSRHEEKTFPRQPELGRKGFRREDDEFRGERDSERNCYADREFRSWESRTIAPRLDNDDRYRAFRRDRYGLDREDYHQTIVGGKISENAVPRQKRISFVGMDDSDEDPNDYTYRGTVKTNREVAYPFSFSKNFRENMFCNNQKTYENELRAISEETRIAMENLVVCENPICNINNACVLRKDSCDFDHDPPLSNRFNGGEYNWTKDERRKSFFDMSRIFIVHKTCNRHKGGESYKREYIDKFAKKQRIDSRY